MSISVCFHLLRGAHSDLFSLLNCCILFCRYQYTLRHSQDRAKAMSSSMTAYREEKLDSIGFIWQAQSDKWMERVHELVEYKREHGNCNVPTRFSSNQPLGSWIKCQRTQYRKFQRGEPCNINQTRADLLTALGIDWDPRNVSVRRNQKKKSNKRKRT